MKAAVPQDSEYPLRLPFLVTGGILGLLAALPFSPLVGFGVMLIFGMAGWLWHRDSPPVFPFVIAYQWLYVIVGEAYKVMDPTFSYDRLEGDLAEAVFLSLVGFFVMALGIRGGIAIAGKVTAERSLRVQAMSTEYDVHRLFGLCLVLYSVGWVSQVSARAISFNAANIIQCALTFREVVFAMLWLRIMQRNEGYRFGIAAIAFVIIPQLTGFHSTFKELLFLFVVVFLSGWRPWVRSARQRRRNALILTSVSSLTAALIFAGLFWESRFKAAFRSVERTGGTVEQLETLMQVAAEETRGFSYQEAASSLVKRLDSVWQFSLVLERVPAVVPHEGGELTKRTFKHILMPRILFPDKADLGGDAWLPTTYAGIEVGEGTSVGIGYMAEFYVDFGVPLMFAPLFVFGFLLGGIAVVLRAFAPSQLIGNALATVAILTYLTSYESNFTKLMGGLTMTVILYCLFLRFGAATLHRWALGSASNRPQSMAPVRHGDPLVREPQSGMPEVEGG